ncbi:hypothetical protein F511_28005 [Dorcoceras hygrometricum]|uniref:S-protein homolog n=1 Tax=Dorcoceras hygrometricum TaxID=472368 RepID=A0A2Z7C7E8_9LAMI|nr:hypothetical protein F511_28005 [Dorcoceras hygrometricum]
MYSTMMKTIFTLFITSNMLLQQTTLACFLASKFHIYVINNLPPYTPPLRVHCQSRNDDLGYHDLVDRGQNFTWSFCESFAVNTLYFCHLWWDNKEKSFDAFKSNFHIFRLDTYLWYATKDGIYSNADYSQKVVKKYDWDIIH